MPLLKSPPLRLRSYESTENIGARRLHTMLERLLEQISFNATDLRDPICIDAQYVEQQLGKGRARSGFKPIYFIVWFKKQGRFCLQNRPFPELYFRF